MKNWVLTLLIIFSLSSSLFAESLEQKKSNLEKALEVGAITKVEYNKSIEHLKNLDQKKENKELKRNLSFTNKKKDTKLKKFLTANKEDKEKITLKKIEELGPIIKYDISYYTNSMIKDVFGAGCKTSFKCQGEKAGSFMYKNFNRSKAYTQKNPGKMIKAMAMYEVFYGGKLWNARKSIARYKENDYEKNKLFKLQDEKTIRSLIGINKGRKSMREALGMTIETPPKEAIRKFWLLGDFLDLGTGVNNKKLAKDLKQRKEKLADYKLHVTNLRKKLQEDLEKEEDEKSVE